MVQVVRCWPPSGRPGLNSWLSASAPAGSCCGRLGGEPVHSIFLPLSIKKTDRRGGREGREIGPPLSSLTADSQEELETRLAQAGEAAHEKMNLAQDSATFLTNRWLSCGFAVVLRLRANLALCLIICRGGRTARRDIQPFFLSSAQKVIPRSNIILRAGIQTQNKEAGHSTLQRKGKQWLFDPVRVTVPINVGTHLRAAGLPGAVVASVPWPSASLPLHSQVLQG